jgi:hypothetical protein
VGPVVGGSWANSFDDSCGVEIEATELTVAIDPKVAIERNAAARFLVFITISPIRPFLLASVFQRERFTNSPTQPRCQNLGIRNKVLG